MRGGVNGSTTPDLIQKPAQHPSSQDAKYDRVCEVIAVDCLTGTLLP
jgi:hypothetical protein